MQRFELFGLLFIPTSGHTEFLCWPSQTENHGTFRTGASSNRYDSPLRCRLLSRSVWIISSAAEIIIYEYYTLPSSQSKRISAQPTTIFDFFTRKMGVIICLHFLMFFSMGPSRPLFLYLCPFYKLLTVHNWSIKIAYDWIRTLVLWYRKRPHCHNHCPMFQRAVA